MSTSILAFTAVIALILALAEFIGDKAEYLV